MKRVKLMFAGIGFSAAAMVLPLNSVFAAEGRDLVDAVAFGDVQAVRTLLEEGIDANFLTEEGAMSLVQNASTYGHPEILQLLLAAGSEIDAQTFGLTALHFAATNLKEESEDIARILIAAGANLDLQTDEGETALMWTAKFHAVEIMKMLIDGGANLEIRNANNVTVLEFAQCVSDEDYQELLLDAGAKPYTPRPRVSDGTEWDFLQFSPECRPVKLIQGMSWEDVNAATGGLLTTRLEAER